MTVDDPLPDPSNIELRLILSASKSTDGLYIGYITTKTGIPIGSITQAFSRLESAGLMRLTDDVLHLTAAGRRWMISNQNQFLWSGEKKWRAVPDRFKGNTIKPFEPYAPRSSRLSKKDFAVDGAKKIT